MIPLSRVPLLCLQECRFLGPRYIVRQPQSKQSKIRVMVKLALYTLRTGFIKSNSTERDAVMRRSSSSKDPLLNRRKTNIEQDYRAISELISNRHKYCIEIRLSHHLQSILIGNFGDSTNEKM